MPVEVRHSKDDSAWREFVSAHPGARVEHDLAWRDVFARTYGYQPQYLMVRDESGVTGVLPLFAASTWRLGRCLVSLPFLDCGGPVASSPWVRDELMAAARRQATDLNAAYLEVRTLSPSADGATTHTHKAKLVLNLVGDADAMWKAVGPKVRNQVRRAEKQGLEIRVDTGERLDMFYRLYSHNMRDLGSPAAPRRLFTHAFECFGARAKLITLWLGDQAVAGAVWLHSGRTAYVPWASSLRRFFSLSPNNLLYWEAIRMACEARCREFDFGRSTIDSGPYRFKTQWGAQPQQLYWQYYCRDGVAAPPQPNEQRGFRLASSIWRRLPVCAANLLGPWIVARMP